MKIDLSNLFNGSDEVVNIDYSLGLSDLIYSTYNPIKKDVSVKGSVFSKADVVYLQLQIEFEFCGFCDRCADEIVKNFSLNSDKILVESLAGDTDSDDYLVVENRELLLDQFVTEEILLSLPTKILCKEQCLGLCHKCGKNLNLGKCSCKSDVDPRMEVLLQLLNEE